MTITKRKNINKQIKTKDNFMLIENNTASSLEQQNETAEVINIRSAKKAQEKASAELLDYMIWTMKHDMDPHKLYEDPIEVFRNEIKATQFVA